MINKFMNVSITENIKYKIYGSDYDLKVAEEKKCSIVDYQDLDEEKREKGSSDDNHTGGSFCL